MLEANYLVILLTPNYEKPIDTPQDVLDRGLTVLSAPGTGSKVEILKKSEVKIDRELAKMMIVVKVIIISSLK